MSNQVVVRPVVSWRDRRRFQRLPWAIYSPPGASRDPNWVPPILAKERELLGWGKEPHPFYDNAEITTLIAERNGRAVGRLAVLVNRIHNRKYDERLGFFGFFECTNDPGVAHALFDAGGAWLRQRGMTAVRGPANPSLNYTCGLLVDGFDRPPRLLMTYNPAYYAGLLESCGLVKSQDLYAYEMDLKLLAALVARYKPAVRSALERYKLVIRPFKPRNFQQDVQAYLELYNCSLDGTWGFTPLQPGEARRIGAELQHIIVPRFAVFAEVDGRAVGASLALLDYNQILKKLNGRLWPLGLLRLLLGRKGITTARAMAMTMLPGYQSSGLGIVLMDNLVGAAAEGGWKIQRYEFSWVLESNASSRGTLERAGTKVIGTYRIYDKAL